jgi:hypothetical protein
MINMKEIIRQMSENAEGINAFVGTISVEQAVWKPGPDIWCMKEVMEHVYNEERIDFRKHIKEMLSDPPQAWNEIREDYIVVETFRQALDGFLVERKASIVWLTALADVDWDGVTQTNFGPGNSRTLRAGDILVSWVAHDFLHLRQMNELLFAWNENQASPYSVDYAGGW